LARSIPVAESCVLTSKSLQSKVFSYDRGGLWIEALVPGEEGLSIADAISFRLAEVRLIRGYGEAHTIIQLEKNTEIVIGLPYAELTRKIRECDLDVLDLKADTDLTPRAQLSKRLKAAFAEAQEALKYASIEEMRFTAYVRERLSADFEKFSFTGRDIDARNIQEGGSVMGGQVLTFTLRERTSPWGTKKFLLEGTLAEFQQLCREAYTKGLRELDLSAFSSRKGLTIADEKRAELKLRKLNAELKP